MCVCVHTEHICNYFVVHETPRLQHQAFKLWRIKKYDFSLWAVQLRVSECRRAGRTHDETMYRFFLMFFSGDFIGIFW